MNIAEAIALWVGLFAGVVSIVLATVAMVFTYVVDKRSSAINEQMIQSLQKIETSVERVAGDTSDLIKVAWDRMLPGESQNGSGREEESDDAIRAIAAGVAAEMRAELEPLASASQNQAEAVERLDRAVGRIQGAVAAQLAEGRSDEGSSSVAAMERRLSRLGPREIELLKAVAETRSHLSRKQYEALVEDSRMREAMRRLRLSRFLMPLKSEDPDEENPVYYLAPGSTPRLTALLSMYQKHGPAHDYVRQHLARVGYLDAPSTDSPQRRRADLGREPR